MSTVCLFGAPLDTGNLGVTALGESLISGVAEADPAIEPVVFDNGIGVRRSSSNGLRTHIGARLSKRVHLPESYLRMRMDHWMGRRNPGVDAISRALGVLDISGGDSFTDLYGMHRFQTVVAPKELTIQLRRPLVLMPQTYGPFIATRSRRRAAEILRRASLALSRDEASAETMAELLGSDFDPGRHRSGVDVAFALRPQDPPAPVIAQLEGWRRTGPLVGLNVSGLLYNDPRSAARFGLRSDYRNLVHDLVHALLQVEGDVRILLVPHVLAPPSHTESDPAACDAVRRALQLPASRLLSLDRRLSAGQTKSVIAMTDWFCGTRMHSTIAGLSAGVPTAAIAYSGKTAGVFGTCGRVEEVFDARTTTAAGVVDGLVESFRQRGRLVASSDHRVRVVVDRARHQVVDVVEWLTRHGDC